MEQRNLGHSGISVSSLCLGAMTFGTTNDSSMMYQIDCDEPTSFAIMDRALDAGINFIDTANVYGNRDGLSETVVGKWLTASKNRDAIVLATKFRGRMGDGPFNAGGSRLHIMRAVEDSLRRLNTDRIDLYQIHMQDSETPEEETLRALDDLVRQGKVLYIGASNYAAYRLVNAMWLSDTRRLERFVTLQAQYSLIVRELERELVPVCREFSLGLLPWSPLAGGFLTGKWQRGDKPPSGTRLEKWAERYGRYDSERGWQIIDAITEIARQTNASPSQVSLAWLLAKPQVSSVIFGARSLDQLEDNLGAANLELTAEQIATLDDASAFELGYPYEMIQAYQGPW